MTDIREIDHVELASFDCLSRKRIRTREVLDLETAKGCIPWSIQEPSESTRTASYPRARLQCVASRKKICAAKHAVTLFVHRFSDWVMHWTPCLNRGKTSMSLRKDRVHPEQQTSWALQEIADNNTERRRISVEVWPVVRPVRNRDTLHNWSPFQNFTCR